MRLTSAARAFVWIRLAFWAGAIVSLLWRPVRGTAVPPFDVGEAHLDLIFTALAQWDAQWFVHIAEHGYDSSQAPAFFPLLPLLMAGLGRAIGSYIVAGTLISLVAGTIGAVLVHRIARDVLDERVADDSVLYLALYPIAFVFTTAYSEGLFLAFSAGSFLAAMRGRGLLAGVLGALAVATRFVGIALVVPLVLLLWPRRHRAVELVRLLPVALLAVPIGAFAWYLHDQVGSATAFLHAHTERNRETPALGPLAGLWDGLSAGYHGAAELVRHLPAHLGGTAGYPNAVEFGTWNLVRLLVLLAALALTWYAWRSLGAVFGGYSLAMLAIVLAGPLKVFPLEGMPRFVIVDFPLFIALADLTATRPRLRMTLLCAFAGIGAVATVAFAHALRFE